MDNLGQHIIEQQNTDTCIRQIAAQKKIYSNAKDLFNIQCVIATIIPVIISISQILFPDSIKSFEWIFIFYSVSASITELVLEKIISSLKETAASIQEFFDTTVLNIDWNSVLLAEKPSPETVFKYYSKYVNKYSVEKLYNWYSIEIKNVKTNTATVICQRTNCVYDFSLRKKYNSGLFITAFTTFALLLVLAFVADITLQKFLTNVVFPSIPIFILATKQYFSNQDSINNLKSLRSLIESTLQNIALNSMISNTTIREIQDKIYNNRISSPMLPDWVFSKFRNNLESQMHFAVKDVIERIDTNNWPKGSV